MMQGMPPGKQGMPPQQGGGKPPMPPQGGDKGGGAGGFGQVVSQTYEGISQIGSVLEKAKAPPAAMQLVAKIQQDFTRLIETLQGGGDDEGQEMAPKGPADEMAGPGGAVPV